jgi:ABC-type glycerol-3-phosphate transport system permease component
MRRHGIPARIGAYIVVAVLVVLSALPTVYMVDLSLRNAVQSFEPSLISGNPTLANYVTVLSDGSFLNYFKNSLIVSVLSVLLTLAVVVLASFGLSRMRIRGRNFVFYALIAGMMIPLASLIVPLTVSLKNMDLLNNYFGLIGPFAAIGTPFGLLVLKGTMDSFPTSLEEASVLDGASAFRTLWSVILPTTVPSLLVVAVWQFLYSWNEFFLSLVVMTNQSMKTVPLLPLVFQGPYMTDPGALFAILTVVSVVPMVVYASVQKWFVRGLMEGGVKE